MPIWASGRRAWSGKREMPLLNCRLFAVVVQAALLEAYAKSDAVKDAELGYCLAGRAFSISSKSLSTCLLSVLCSL
jgi:hypothetical protein